MTFEEDLIKLTPVLRTVIYKTTKRPQEVDDVLSEVYIKALQNKHKFDPCKATFKHWMLVLARNTSIDFFRKTKNTIFNDLPITDLTDSYATHTPFQNIHAHEDSEQILEKAALRLTSDQYTCFYLSVIDEKPRHEIASTLNITVGEVARLYQQAISILQNSCVESE